VGNNPTPQLIGGKDMGTRKVKVQSGVGGQILITDRDRFRKEWKRKGEIQLVPFDMMNDLQYDDGVLSMLKDGVLIIVDRQDRIDLGIDEPGEGDFVKSYTDEEVVNFWNGNDADFINEIGKISRDQIGDWIETCLNNKIMPSPAKKKVVYDRTGSDIYRLISNCANDYQEEVKKE
jgi:hypothetical protein